MATRLPKLRAAGLASLFVLPALVGCESKPPAAQPTVTVDPISSCTEAEKRGTTLTVLERPSTVAALDAAMKHGIAVVHFTGCELTVLAGCDGLGSYDAAPPAEPERHFQISDAKKLYDLAPLGAPAFERDLADGGALDITAFVTTTRAVKGAPAMLSGECAGATHWLARADLGAYLVTKTHADSSERILQSGDPARCRATPTDATCAAPVAVELIPIHH